MMKASLLFLCIFVHLNFSNSIYAMDSEGSSEGEKFNTSGVIAPDDSQPGKQCLLEAEKQDINRIGGLSELYDSETAFTIREEASTSGAHLTNEQIKKIARKVTKKILKKRPEIKTQPPESGKGLFLEQLILEMVSEGIKSDLAPLFVRATGFSITLDAKVHGSFLN
jgi:hypothetical protein